MVAFTVEADNLTVASAAFVAVKRDEQLTVNQRLISNYLFTVSRSKSAYVVNLRPKMPVPGYMSWNNPNGVYMEVTLERRSLKIRSIGVAS